MGVLRVKVGTQWVDVGAGSGLDEVYVGPSQPVDVGARLWFDTDAVAPAMPWNMAWGLMAQALMLNGHTDIPAAETLLNLEALNYTLEVGRRYRISFTNRAARGEYQTTLTVKRNGVDMGFGWYITGQGGWCAFACEAYVNGDGVAGAWTMTATPSTLGLDLSSTTAALAASGLFIEDVGPTVRTT